MNSIKPVCVVLAFMFAGSAQAAVYRCVNEQGEKFISDKACPPAQATQKVYKSPAAPAASARPGAAEGEIEGMPEGATPAEQEALMRTRLMQRIEKELDRQDQERAEQEKQEKADAETRRKNETKRQMESYLQQKQE